MPPGELAQTEFLFTDCQTTGSTPESGHLLEAAWALASATANTSTIHSALALLPDEEEVPARIQRLTGITTDELTSARPPQEIWSKLTKAAGNRPVLAHFARFEERFYRHLHEACHPGTEFPLTFICTHLVACRLLPDLPRRGIRALAGYLGHPLEEMKRAAGHVKATHFIWQQLVTLLEEQGTTTFEQLETYLSQKPPGRGKQWTVPLPREERLALSNGPGIYRFINAAGRVIYIGKATSLKSRVNSYYRKRKKADKELEIVSQAVRIETEATETSLEAALFEAAQIKHWDPPYNTALREAGRAFATAEEVAALAVDTGYPLGKSCPLPDVKLASNWFQMVRWLGTGRLPDASLNELWRLLWLEYHAPCDLDLLGEGAALFLELHGLDSENPLPRLLKRLGLELWLEMRERQRQEREARAAGEPETEEAEEEQAGEAIEEEESEDEEVEITPELIAGRLTGFTMNASHQLRRGRWLSLLPGAVVRWDQKTDPGRREVSIPGDPPDSLQQYDLLRVLTTELRRLSRDGRNPEIRLVCGKGIAGHRLVHILELV